MTALTAIYHFMPLTRHRAAVALVDDLLARGITPVLDLEDSVQCVFDPARSERLKEQARQALCEIAPAMKARGVAPGRVGVRINHAGTRFHEVDMAAVLACHAEGFWPEVLLPKVEGAEEVVGCFERLRVVAGERAQVTPLIESVAGVARMDEIFAVAAVTGRRAVFGYFDYALDAGQWPLLSQYRPEFWELVGRVRGAMEQRGLCYFHPPSAHLEDDAGLLRIKAMLRATGAADFGMCALGTAQSMVLERPVDAAAMDFETVPEGGGEMDPRRRAEWVVRCFEQGRSHKRSFAVADGYFISPHEYGLARRFLEEVEA